MTDRVLHEAFVLYPAWACLVEYVSRTDPAEADPASIYGSLCACDTDRLVALLYAHQPVDTIDEAGVLVAHLLSMARDGRRPKFARELGVTF